MPDLTSSWNNLKLMDELALKKTPVHRRHPLAKLLTTVVFLVAVISLGKYEVGRMLPFFLYPVVIITLADLPPGAFLKPVMLALPFALGIGIFNPIFDHAVVWQVGGLAISGGWVSFISILLRFVLTVMGALMLVATSGMGEVATALLKIGLPRIFVIQLLFLYRYLSVLMEETSRVLRANALRSLNKRGVEFRVWGSLLGQLLLRTLDRAQRIYQAMLCRGFTGEIPLSSSKKFLWQDAAYLIGWITYFIIVRVNNIPELLGSLIMGVGK